jgi:hypothetical protein
MNLLIDLKLDETVEAGISGPNGRTSNPFRQKVKRLMTKLRRVALGSKIKSRDKAGSRYLGHLPMPVPGLRRFSPPDLWEK